MKKNFLITIIAVIILGLFFIFLWINSLEVTENDVFEIEQRTQESKNIFEDGEEEELIESNIEEEIELKENILLPTDVLRIDEFSIVKAIYVTSWSASSENYINYLIRLAREKKINSVVIDIKDWSGYVAYDANVPDLDRYGAKSIKIKNIDFLVERLHREGLYVIARTTIFQDPVLAQARPDLAVHRKSDINALWYDNKGLAWIDPASKESWDYNIAIIKDVLSRGFDEINLDYIRFPSDGKLNDMYFPVWQETTSKSFAIKEFFKYLRAELPGAKLSVDLFGLSTVNHDDLGIGQVIEDSFEYFDFISPMVYPSHYASGFLGFENPAEYPYEIVKYSLDKAQERLIKYNTEKGTDAKLRPWLQDFNLGAQYDAVMVRAQIQAVKDATGEDFNGFMLWNPSNMYTEEALKNIDQ